MYWGKSKVNNETPRSVTNPPPWANLDPRVLSPIPDKKKREACWDDSFPLGHCLQPKEVRRRSKPAAGRKRPASAGVRREHQEPPSGNSGSGGTKSLQGRVRNRPSSADVRGRDAACDNVGNGYPKTQRVPGVDGTSGYNARGCSSRSSGNNTSGGDKGRSSNQRKAGGVFSTEEREILAGGYRLNENQEGTFREFVAMLIDFDTCSMVRILDDVFRETQLATGLQDFTGCGES